MGETSGSRGSLKTDYDFFARLHELGQRATRRFLDWHFGDIGRASTIDARRAKSQLELVE